MLGNFIYSNPTKLYFGKDSLNYLVDELKNYGTKVQLIYGGGSIKKIGLYDEIIKILKACGKEIIEDCGVMPNPTVEKLYEGAKIAKDNNVDLLLAVGGGSVIDYAKAVSASAYCKEDPWQKYYLKMEDVNNKVIPIGCILTMVGTGSEMNGGAVITNPNMKLKIGHVFNDNLYPKFSILNPELTYTVPHYQMVAGFFDIMSHLLEQYFSNDDDNTSDYIIEGLLKSLINSTKIAVNNPTDYEARSNIMWTSTWALNTLVSKGKKEDWMVHMIGQQVGAYTDATHGMTLSAISLSYYRYVIKYGLNKFKRYAMNVWNVSPMNKTDEEIAEDGLIEMEKYMRQIGVCMSLRELGVTEEMIEPIASSTIIFDSGYHKLSKDEIIYILKEAY